MKAFIITIFSAFLFGTIASAQCNPDAMAGDCNAKLGDFTFIKNYKIDPAKATTGVAEFSYVFSKDTQYFVSICDGKSSSPKIEVSLMDSNKKVLSTNKDNGSFYAGIAYKCTTTGIYYISYNIAGATDKCAISALGFKK
jgi:hypothetical protein